jgi:glycerol-3-phosphate acyltransferase PlsY
MEQAAEIALEGRPVAIATAGDVLRVLQRPAGDDKHLGPGWWESFALDGTKQGSRITAGYYPDDLALTPDGRFAVVLCSGRAEGDAKKPSPALEVFDIAASTGPGHAIPIARLELDPADDPERLVLSASGRHVLVTLAHSAEAVAVDLSRAEEPKRAGRIPLKPTGNPYLSVSPDGDWLIMPAACEGEAVAFTLPAREGDAVVATTFADDSTPAPPAPPYLVFTVPEESCLEVIHDSSPRRTLGRLPMKGPFNLGGTHPTGLAYSPRRNLLAVATKPGTVHLIEIRSRTGNLQPPHFPSLRPPHPSS